MKKQKIALIAFPIIAIILEILPFGAVLNFAGDGESVRRTYSYFDLTPYGYANFGPFLTAILTCVLLLLSLIFLFKESKGLKKSITIVSAMAVFTSVMPLFLGLNCYSVVGVLISVVLISELCVLIIKR